jgi:hypothetical protein
MESSSTTCPPNWPRKLSNEERIRRGCRSKSLGRSLLGPTCRRKCWWLAMIGSIRLSFGGVARDRLRAIPDEMDDGYLVAPSRPHELANRLEAYLEHAQVTARKEL